MHNKINAIRGLGALMLAGLLAACATIAGEPEEVPRIDPAAQTDDVSYDKRTVAEAASDVFGEGAEGIGEVVEQVFGDLGRPNAYIAGKEGGGAFIAGLAYGNGILHHKIEGTRPVHWASPSVGFDFGGDAARTFTLVYNLFDTQDVFRRYPQVEGQFYFIAGLGVSYHKRGEVVLAHIRSGVGLRAGVNVGYVKITEEENINPF